MKNNLIYDIHDKPKFHELIVYGFQQVLSCIVATVLIAQLCGTPISSCLLGACVGTLIYQVFTKFSSPMFISSIGATVSAVIGALALGGYTAVAIGGVIIALIYALFSFIIKAKGTQVINKIFPPAIVGAITIVIGANLATFIPTYIQINGVSSLIGLFIAIFTMLMSVLIAHYGKKFSKTIPFLLAILYGYILCVILTSFGVVDLIDFSMFKGITLFSLPEFTFLK